MILLVCHLPSAVVSVVYYLVVLGGGCMTPLMWWSHARLLVDFGHGGRLLELRLFLHS